MFRPEKNQRELVEIAAGLPAGLDWQLWLAGEGPERAACERLVASRGLGARVKFPGFTPDPGPLYASADLAVHASWSESLSNFLIEAQARGLPCVAAEAQGVRECFLPDRTGIVVARGDHAAFRAALARLIAEPAEARAARAAEARAFARATFDPSRQVAAYLDLFQRLAVCLGRFDFRPAPLIGASLNSRKPKAAASAARPDAIRLRGVRQNNLKGFDLDIPLGRFTAVTGLSGTGKSSLVFETLHAEGQRRYVETFSAYTRQFLDLLDKPRVDSIENIRPSIAIDQANTVKTARSTVGTMTELTDYAKVWFSHVAECFDPATGEKVEDDNPATIWAKAAAAHPGQMTLVAFKVVRPDNLTWAEIFTNLRGQGYARYLAPEPDLGLALRRLDEPAGPAPSLAFVHVVQDRVALASEHKLRFLEAVETALHFGRGEVRLFSEPAFEPIGHYSRGLHSPRTGRTFRAATPPLFSFNSPLGACPKCRGFGRVIEIDYRLAIPDAGLSIDAGAIKCWEGEIYGESKRDLLVFARKQRIPTHVPFASLSAAQQDYVVNGEPGYGEENGKTWPKHWYGITGFFRYLETKTYKMHVRVFLSRYRAYNPCPDCGGARLQPEALCWRWRGRTLPGLYQLPGRRPARPAGGRGAAEAPAG